jgi:diguanylate cyclase (GGDEF)-like protein
MKTGDYETSLSYSKRALLLAPKLRLNGFEQTARFNMGIAQIGLRNLIEGQRLAESAIQSALDSGNLIDAEACMGEYGVALERAGAWRAAVDLYHRAEKLRERLMTMERQRALLQLSAQFDAERSTREIEILKRGNAIQHAELRTQRLRQLLVVTVTALIALICVLLGWSFNRVRKMNAQLRYKSEHDALTGLCNRRYLQEHVLANWGERPFQGSLLIVDVDHFKQINDVFGHAAGDMVLARLGKRLAESLRKGDALVRWGGEEFLVVLESMSEANLRAIASNLLTAVRNEILVWHGQTIHCTASIGYASFPLSGTQPDVSLSRAVSLVDKALYQAKQRGRDRACFISSLHAASEQDLHSISEEFDTAAADRRVQLLELTAN